MLNSLSTMCTIAPQGIPHLLLSMQKCPTLLWTCWTFTFQREKLLGLLLLMLLKCVKRFKETWKLPMSNISRMYTRGNGWKSTRKATWLWYTCVENVSLWELIISYKTRSLPILNSRKDQQQRLCHWSAPRPPYLSTFNVANIYEYFPPDVAPVGQDYSRMNLLQKVGATVAGLLSIVFSLQLSFSSILILVNIVVLRLCC